MHPLSVAKPLRFFLPLVLFVYFFGLGMMPLVGPDEPRYAQVGREMFERRDFVTPTLDGKPWFEKPALLYWMMMASYGVFGVTEFAARFGAAVSGVLTVLLVAWFGSRIEEKSDGTLEGFGVMSGAVAASSLGLIAFAHGASFDIVLTMTTTATLISFLLAEHETDARRRRFLLVAAYAAIGLGLLAKGLVGIVIPGGVLGLYFLLRRRLPDKALWSSLLWGGVIASAVAGVWYAPVILKHGWHFVDVFFIQHHFARYTSNKYRHPQPVYFYLPVLALMSLPWTACLVAALWRAGSWTWRADDARSRVRAFAFAWMLLPMLFFSLSGSKLPGYILPALPGAALLVAEWLTSLRCSDNSETLLTHETRLANEERLSTAAEPVKSRALQATGALMLVVAATSVGFAIVTPEVGVMTSLIVMLPVIAAGVYVLANAHSTNRVVVAITGATLLATTLATVLAMNAVAARHSVRDQLREAIRRGYATEPLYELHTIERTAEFYAARRLAYADNGDPLKLQGAGEVRDVARARGGTVLVLVPLEYQAQLKNFPDVSAEFIGDNGEVALFAVKAK